ncbi:MAG: proton-conducting transporter membrane subunit, partial [Gammaproteobacteria bacterium]
LSSIPLPWQLQLAWVPSLGIGLDWHIDALSAQFLVLITGIGTMVFVYASGYMAHDANAGRFYVLLLLFMAAMIGAVSADHLLLLFLCWELTSLISFFLVGFKHTDDQARASARQALFITLGGGLALLAAFILLAQITGTWSLQAIVASGSLLTEDPRLPVVLVLLFIGCFTKSAQFPFHFWLPNAMSAPTPASAYLHSATMVKLGIYLLARLDPAFNELLLWEISLIGTGTITAVWAAVLALRERDLKRILARSTVSALGTLVLLIGLPNEEAALAVIAFLFAHALYKAPLFFVAGNIDHATGTRSIDHLMGLRRQMPFTTVAAILAGLSMAGLPLSFGYVAKDVVSAAKSGTDLLAIVSYGLLFVNGVAVAVAAVAAIRVFWGPVNPAFKKVREVSWRMLLPPLLIALIGLEFEFMPTFTDPLLVDAARVMAPGADIGGLVADHSFGTFITAAEITLVIGIILFLFWERLHRYLSGLAQLDHYGPAAVFEHLLKGLPRVAAWQTKVLQHGDLAGYMRLTLAVLLLLGIGGWLAGDADWSVLWAALWSDYEQGWALAAAAVLIVAGALAAPFIHNRLALLMAVGLVGYGSAVLFLFAGAPDVAFTQFMVETVLVVVAAAVLSRYGEPGRYPERRMLNAAIALAAGIGTFILLAHMFSLPADRSLAEWFAANSLPEAHGRNVVNVILVDFRALDTFGEIAVVAFSALAAWPLLRNLRKRRSDS